MSVIKKSGFCALLVLLCFGCAPKERPRILFPPPPEVSRLEFIGVYSSENSFEKSSMERFRDNVLGSSASAQFKSPLDIVSDSQGVVYVSDIHWRNLRVYDFNKKTVEFYLKTPPFKLPTSLALDSQGRLYVADSEKGTVFVFGPDRSVLRTFGTPQELTRPAGLALNESLGRIYVADGLGHRIVVYDLAGKHLFSFGTLGVGADQFYSPQGMAFGPDGNLYVADQYNARIQVVDAEGNFVRQFGERGDQASQFELPKDVAFDSDGNLHISDGRRSHILAYSPEGQLLLVTGGDKPSAHALSFVAPRGIFIDQNDRIYVADLLARRFSVWQYLSAAYLDQHPITDADRELIQRSFQKE